MTWFIVVLIFACIKLHDMKDTCSRWRLKIHHDIEESNQILPKESFILHFGPTVLPSMKPYTDLQLLLEDIAENCTSREESCEDANEGMCYASDVQALVEECEKYHVVHKCDSDSLYRRADGICNNLKHPLWGSGSYIVDRMLPPSYVGINGFRKSVTGEDLPSARKISLKLESRSRPSHLVSATFPYYGQNVAHDITEVPGIATSGTIDCCDPNYNPSVCKPVYCDKNDPFYIKSNVSCIPMLRTAPYPTCDFNKRIQVNKETSFLDLSIIYGRSLEIEKDMRGQNNLGRLKTQDSESGRILPKCEIDGALFCPINQTDWCFLSGDERVNQHLLLMSVQTMFVRLHNQMHDILQSLNPHWDGDILYQETRRLVIALQQNMVYSEFLPILVGHKNMKKHNLFVHCDSGSSYDEEQCPNVLNEFNTASMRLHSMLPKKPSKFHPKISFDLLYSFTCPIHQGQIGSYVGGACEVPAERNDHFVDDVVTSFLYRPPRATFGIDIVSRNIARGRDNGLPPYVDVVELCSNGEITITSFSCLSKLMSFKNIRLLESIYSDVRDIDLWVGLILEREIRGAVTGRTAACISSTQFHRIKFGDSFFFTHTNGRYPFTKAQLETIRSYSMARFFCDAADLSQVRRHPLKLAGEENPFIYCKNFSTFDLSAWKEKK